jgi:hypothetical protein
MAAPLFGGGFVGGAGAAPYVPSDGLRLSLLNLWRGWKEDPEAHILAYEGDSQWFWFEGNFESYEKNKVDRLGAEASRPHRVTYRKLTR